VPQPGHTRRRGAAVMRDATEEAPAMMQEAMAHRPGRTVATRRSLLRGLLVAPTLSCPAFAQRGFPERPVRLIVPLGPGTATDTFARQVTAGIQPALGQPIVIENRAGGNSLPGTEAALRSTPDGYTLLFATDFATCLAPALFRRLPFAVPGDFNPVAGLASIDYVVVVAPTLPVRSVADFIALAKAQPGQLAVGSTAVGATSHLLGEAFAREADIDLLFVQYQSGASQLLSDLVTGRIAAMFYPFQPIKSFIEQGRLRPIATASAERPEWMRDLPTLRELGFRQAVYSSSFAVYAPMGVPADRIARLADAFRQVVTNADFRASLTAVGVTAAFLGPEELGAAMVAGTEKCRALVALSGVPQQ
jgi:tripartite-type tricarboxylate transporter receptor subunit TctC